MEVDKRHWSTRYNRKHIAVNILSLFLHKDIWSDAKTPFETKLLTYKNINKRLSEAHKSVTHPVTSFSTTTLHDVTSNLSPRKICSN